MENKIKHFLVDLKEIIDREPIGSEIERLSMDIRNKLQDLLQMLSYKDYD
jgi:hypothetical protein